MWGVVPESANSPSFEEAIGRLEKIVDSMESGDVPLAELLAKYEAGNQLVGVCENHLKEAELKIELLKKQNGAPSLSRFESEKDSD